ncbi:aspartyl aminopeptidase [Infundibulicybe gibba]|nr:aspartyl aminopeptidase [Infundibulicybe gibba]
MQMVDQSSPEAATKFLKFVNASPTPFHAVSNAAARLEKAGFQKISEKDEWEKSIRGGGKYYFTRNQAALVAFTLPQKWQHGAGVSIVATHVDSPNLRVRPISKRSKAGYLQVGVETYGGGIWHSWLDRDLSIAGRVVVADKTGGTFKPLLRIPTLAIHLDGSVNNNFKFNQETDFVQTNHHPALLSLLASECRSLQRRFTILNCKSLYDTQPATLGGINNEFIFSPRMDNLVSSFCAVEAIAESVTSQSFPSIEGNVNCIALFNHEEIGSVSTSGAESSLIPSLLNRLSPTPSSFAQSISHSFLISADMGHAVHPNYTSKHEDKHKPVMNRGIVIKTNAEQSYSSDAITTFIVKQLVERKGGKVQEFEVRNDMPCGSTVGPMLSKIGIRTVDTAGSHDVQNAIDLFSSLFEGFAALDKGLTVD